MICIECKKAVRLYKGFTRRLRIRYIWSYLVIRHARLGIPIILGGFLELELPINPFMEGWVNTQSSFIQNLTIDDLSLRPSDFFANFLEDFLLQFFERMAR